MPTVTRSRVIGAPVGKIWELVSDPYNMPRWWPRCVRVEDVAGAPGARRTRWTAVMETEKGRSVRADYRCVSAAEDERYAWEQEVEGTPFEHILRSSSVQIELEPAEGSADARVRVRAEQRLRGLSRLGSPMMRTGTARNLDAAIDGIEAALT
jgi:uncharacterized protein YndB with AHSA1/START domain